jgi:DNA invertase Pin-like site-specific DNA recombinase
MNNYRNLDTSKLNYVIYCRKSSEGEDKQVQSLDTQLRELTEHAEKNNLNIVETISESKSAFKVGREGFDRMMALMKSGKANAVLVVRANRISRNPIDAGYVVSLMDEKKLLYIRTPNSTCYTSSSTDKMMIALELIFSKKDSDDKGDMVKEGQKSKALKGIPHGGASIGFLNDKTEEKGNRTWKVDPDRFWKIQKLFEMFLTGNYSAGKLYRYAVEELKLDTFKRKVMGGNLIVPSRIYEILKDPVYAGFFFQGGERYELSKALPTIITEQQREKIIQLLSKKAIPKIQNHQSLYSGFLLSDEGDFMGQDVKYQLICDCKHKFAYRGKDTCPNCNKEIDKLENSKYLVKSYYYNNRKKKAKLPYKSIEEAVINKEMESYITENLSFSNDMLQWSKKYIHELKDKEVNDGILISKDRERRNEDFETKKRKMREMLRDGKITDEEYSLDLNVLKKEYSDTEQTLVESNWYEEMIGITDIIEKINDVMKNGTFEAKRSILSQAGSNLTWNDKILSIHSKKSINTLIEGIKRIKSEFPKFEPRNYVAIQGLNEKNEPFDPIFSMMLHIVNEVITYFKTTNQYHYIPSFQ